MTQSPFDILDRYAAEDARRMALIPSAEQLAAAKSLMNLKYDDAKERLLRPLALCNETITQTCQRILRVKT